MHSSDNIAKWITIPNWLTAGLVDFSKANGLIRVQLQDETMFLGHAAKGGLGPRVRTYARRKGSDRHYARRMIYEHSAEIEFQVAALDMPAEDILQILATELAKGRPPWNVPNGHRLPL